MDSNYEAKDSVNKGKYDIVFMSPELIVGKWRNLFGSPVYQERLVGLVINEANCVVKW